MIAHITDSYNYFCAHAAGNKVEWSDPVEKGNSDKDTLMPKLKEAVGDVTPPTALRQLPA